MKSRTRKSYEIHPHYLSLIRLFPLRPIRTLRDYQTAMKIVSKLSVRNEGSLSRGETDYLDALVVLLEAYDAKAGAIPSILTGVDLLRHLMESNGLGVADIGRIIGSQPTASLILGGRREMSKAVIRKLSAHFGVQAGLFFDSTVAAA